MALAAASFPSQARQITIIAREYHFEPNILLLKKGEHVTVLLENKGTLSHNLTIPGLGVKTDSIQSGDSTTLRFTAYKAGAYSFL